MERHKEREIVKERKNKNNIYTVRKSEREIKIMIERERDETRRGRYKDTDSLFDVSAIGHVIQKTLVLA